MVEINPVIDRLYTGVDITIWNAVCLQR